MDQKQNQLNKLSAIFLLAGFGKRISNITKDPKCLLKINKETLIDKNLNILKRLNIKDVTLVLGYKKELIKKLIKNILTLNLLIIMIIERKEIPIHYLEDLKNQMETP